MNYIQGLYGATGLLATSSEHSLGAASLHKLIEAAGGSLHAGNTSLLDLANKVKTGFRYLFREIQRKRKEKCVCADVFESLGDSCR